MTNTAAWPIVPTGYVYRDPDTNMIAIVGSANAGRRSDGVPRSLIYLKDGQFMYMDYTPTWLLKQVRNKQPQRYTYTPTWTITDDVYDSISQEGTVRRRR